MAIIGNTCHKISDNKSASRKILEKTSRIHLDLVCCMCVWGGGGDNTHENTHIAGVDITYMMFHAKRS